MPAPEGLKNLIRSFEGLRLKAYQCPAGIWTCGYGSTGPDVVAGVVWTPEYAESRMASDADSFFDAATLLAPEATENQVIAMADFAYNFGVSRLKSSTLLRKFKGGDIHGAADEFLKWTRAGGRILPGLVIRRQAEQKIFLQK